MQQTVRAAFRRRPAAGPIAPRPLVCTLTDILGHMLVNKRTPGTCSPCNLLTLLSVCLAGGLEDAGRVLQVGEGAAIAKQACAEGVCTVEQRASVEVRWFGQGAM